jgi:hypothetical protein
MSIFSAILLLATATGSQGITFPDQPGRPILPVTTAQELVRECSVSVRFNEDESSVAESEYPDSYICLGIMEGILNTSAVIAAVHPEVELFCPPEAGIKNWHAAKILVEYAKQHPEQLELNGVQLTLVALTNQYPCKGSK